MSIRDVTTGETFTVPLPTVELIRSTPLPDNWSFPVWECEPLLWEGDQA